MTKIGVKPRSRLSRLTRLDDGGAAEIARTKADHELHHEVDQNPQAELLQGGAGGDDLDKRDRQEDRHRIVGAGFDLQRGTDLVADRNPADTQQEEDGGGVGGSDDRAEQHGFEPGQAEDKMGGGTENQRREHHAQCREREGGRGRVAEGLQRRAEAGIEQDDGERDGPDEIGDRRVVEVDPQTVDAGNQADAEEEKQKGRAETVGEQAGEGRDNDQERADQDGEIHGFDHCRFTCAWHGRTRPDRRPNASGKGRTRKIRWRYPRHSDQKEGVTQRYMAKSPETIREPLKRFLHFDPEPDCPSVLAFRYRLGGAAAPDAAEGERDEDDQKPDG